MPTHITNDDRSANISILTWIMMVSMCCSVLAKLVSGIRVVPLLSRDTILTLLATVFSIAQGIAVTEQVSAGGLGKKQRNLTLSQLESFQKAGYAAQLLYIIGVALTKAMTIQLLSTISWTQHSQKMIKAMVIGDGLWALISLLGAAFQCRLPHAWAIISNNCFDQSAFWDFSGTFDVFLDFCLTVTPIVVLWDLQTAMSKKVPVMAAFGARCLTIPSTILRMVYISRARSSPDHPFDDYNVALTTQVGLNMGIIIACLPFLKTVMDQLESSVYSPQVHNRDTYGYGSQDGSYALSSFSKPSRVRGKGVEIRSPENTWPGDSHMATITTIAGTDSPRPSSGGSEQMIIKQTKTFTVASENPGEPC